MARPAGVGRLRGLRRGTAEFFRPGYQHHLTTDWIPALDGVADALAEGGAVVADVGCGHGISSVVTAQASPNAEIHGFDYHAPSIAAFVGLATNACRIVG